MVYKAVLFWGVRFVNPTSIYGILSFHSPRSFHQNPSHQEILETWTWRPPPPPAVGDFFLGVITYWPSPMCGPLYLVFFYTYTLYRGLKAGRGQGVLGPMIGFCAQFVRSECKIYGGFFQTPVHRDSICLVQVVLFDQTKFFPTCSKYQKKISKIIPPPKLHIIDDWPACLEKNTRLFGVINAAVSFKSAPWFILKVTFRIHKYIFPTRWPVPLNKFRLQCWIILMNEWVWCIMPGDYCGWVVISSPDHSIADFYQTEMSIIDGPCFADNIWTRKHC